MQDPTMDNTYGAAFIGVLVAVFFQGILTVQAYIYYESFPDDRRALKILVASVWLLDATHLIMICQTAYHYLVTSWGVDSALLEATRPLDLHLIFIAAPTLLCQAFFLHRIWIFSKGKWILPTILGAACLVVFALNVAISGQIVQVPSVAYFSVLKGEVVAAFSTNAVVDVAIALVLLVYLQQGKMQTMFDRTSFVLSRVMEYTVATGLATSLFAVACLIAYLVSPHTFIFIAMHFSLGRLYTNALLATLNSRRMLRYVAQLPTPFAVMTTRVVTTVVDDVGEYPMSPRSAKPFSEIPMGIDVLRRNSSSTASVSPPRPLHVVP